MDDLKLEDLLNIDQGHIWHPLLQHRFLKEKPLIPIRSAHGCTLVDYAGNEYLDAFAGLWNVNVGYGRSEIAEAVFEQMKKLAYYPQTQVTLPAALLAERLASILSSDSSDGGDFGDLKRVFFCNSGSEANETALKLARQYASQKYPGKNRHKVIGLYRGYHGFTMGALSATGQAPRKHKFEPLVPGFYHAHPPYCYRCPLNLKYPECRLLCAEDIERIILQEGPDTVIGVIMEPIIGGGGVIVPPDDYLSKVRQICDKYGLLLILDEVITGFGRTGSLFAFQRSRVQPDIVTLAKGLTSGYLPLGACVTNSRVFEAFLGEAGSYQEFAQVSTYGGHPTCCAAALANIKIILEERLWENAEKVGSYLLAELRELLRHPLVGEVRGKGLMIAIELVKDGMIPLDSATTSKIQQQIRKRGVLVGKVGYAAFDPENILYLAPPLILTSSEADRIVAAVKEAIESISNA